jgi:hypothetical protein
MQFIAKLQRSVAAAAGSLGNEDQKEEKDRCLASLVSGNVKPLAERVARTNSYHLST